MSKTPKTDKWISTEPDGGETVPAFIARQFEQQVADKNELLMKTNHVHIENQRLQKDLDCERETNQRLTDELAEARAEIERLDHQRRAGWTEVKRKDKLIEQMREALGRACHLCSVLIVNRPAQCGQCIVYAALSAAERITK